jgi:hypothetical protein
VSHQALVKRLNAVLKTTLSHINGRSLTSIPWLEFKNSVFIAGGAVSSGLSGDSTNDYDLYFKNTEIALAVIDKLAGSQITSDATALRRTSVVPYHKGTFSLEFLSATLDPEWLEGFQRRVASKKNSLIRFLSPNALTIAPVSVDAPVQLVTRFIGYPDQVLESFDFAHCHFYYNPSNETIKGSVPALLSLATRQLNYQGTLFPLTSMIRSVKFVKRGWRMSATQYIKLVANINTIDWNDVEQVADQLKGVDTDLMLPVLELLRTQGPHPDLLRQLLTELE